MILDEAYKAGRPGQRAAFRAWVEKGGPFVGIHGAGGAISLLLIRWLPRCAKVFVRNRQKARFDSVSPGWIGRMDTRLWL